MDASDRPLFWIGSSLDDLRSFPEDVRRVIGFALRRAQDGGKHVDAKPLKGFGGAGVLEIVEDDDGNTYRAVYTVKFAGVVYVLHAFQKKSKKGITTPKHEIDLVRSRLKRAEEHYLDWCKERGSDHEQ
ncbi:MAG: type II toxin-antitoxin system RelE/ParE family toxin [Armatimonadota bacterium]